MVIDVKCIIMLFTAADQMLQMWVMICSILFVWLLFTPQVMFQQYQQVKSIHSRNYRWIQSHSCRLHDVPVVITNRQCIELKGFHKSFPRLTTIASKNEYFGHFCTKPDRALPDSMGTVTLSRSRMGAGKSNVLLQILQGLLSDDKQCRVLKYWPVRVPVGYRAGST